MRLQEFIVWFVVIVLQKFTVLFVVNVLQGKYTEAMRDKADYSDSIERLEHIIMQLEGESETIGNISCSSL